MQGMRAGRKNEGKKGGRIKKMKRMEGEKEEVVQWMH